MAFVIWDDSAILFSLSISKHTETQIDLSPLVCSLGATFWY